jgi:hypothetical protein
MMGDRGVHTLDAACNALDLGKPSSIERLSIEGANEFVHPDKARVRYQFPARGAFPGDGTRLVFRRAPRRSR